MTSIYEDGARKARREVLKLVSVGITTPTDEQIASRKSDNEKYKPKGQFVIQWEPLSYKIEGGKYGNVTTDYLDFTFPLDDEQLATVRQFGWRGAGNANVRLSIPSSEAQAKDKWTKFMIRAHKAGLELSFDEAGNLTSKSIGEVFEVESGSVVLPTRIQDPKNSKWRDSIPENGERAFTPFMNLPVQKLDNYVQPDDVPVRIISTNEDDTEATPASTSGGATAQPAGVSPEQLASAFAEAGMIGADVESYKSSAQQVSVTNKFGTRAPIFFTKEIQDAASNGSLIDYAVAKGAIVVNDGVITKAEA